MTPPSSLGISSGVSSSSAPNLSSTLNSVGAEAFSPSQSEVPQEMSPAEAIISQYAPVLNSFNSFSAQFPNFAQEEKSAVISAMGSYLDKVMTKLSSTAAPQMPPEQMAMGAGESAY